MAKQLVVDPKKCVACRTCELVCSFKHNEEFNPRLSNVSVFHYEEAAITVPIMCMQCDEACCAAICPTGALKRNADGALSRARIIMLTARGEAEDIVDGLDAGADDYVVKPFDRKVLLARIRAVLRRGGSQPGESFDGLSIDEAALSATLDGNALDIPRGEFMILSLLCANKGRVLTRRRILDRVLADDVKAVSERTVDVQVANLRRRLGRWADHIETVRGVGYRVRA